MVSRDFVATGVAAFLALAVCVLRFWVLTPAQAGWLQVHCGYYMVLAAFLWFILSVVRHFRPRPVNWHEVGRVHGWGLAVVVVCSGLVHLHEPHMLKVLFDEPGHVAGSLMMHQDRLVEMPGQAHRLTGDLVLFNRAPSFRLYLFQFLLSLVHDITGYRVSNVFILNGVLACGLFLGLYVIGCRYGGSRYGVLAVLLMATSPLLAQVATSGSYDLLNLVLIAALLLTTWHYGRQSGRGGLDLMLATGVLLALSRYESIVYLLVPIAAMGAKWWNERRVSMTWCSALSPLLTLPCFVANLVMMSNEVHTLANVRKLLKTEFFELRHLWPHLLDAGAYLFSFDLDTTSSLVLSVLGLAGMVAMAVAFVVRNLAKRVWPDWETGMAGMVILVSLGLFGLVLCNFWGILTDPMASRFSLPLHLVFVLAILWGARDFLRQRLLPTWCIWSVVAWVGLATIPATAKHTATDTMVVAQHNDWLLRYVTEHDRGRTLYVSQSHLPLLIRGFPATRTGALNLKPEKALQVVQAGFYEEVLVSVVLRTDPVTGEFGALYDDLLDSRFCTELVAETKLLPYQVSRIVRIIGLKQPDGSILTAKTMPPLQQRFKNADEQSRYLISLLP